MYDSESGFFYDIRLNDRTSVKVMGADGVVAFVGRYCYPGTSRECEEHHDG